MHRGQTRTRLGGSSSLGQSHTPRGRSWRSQRPCLSPARPRATVRRRFLSATETSPGSSSRLRRLVIPTHPLRCQLCSFRHGFGSWSATADFGRIPIAASGTCRVLARSNTPTTRERKGAKICCQVSGFIQGPGMGALHSRSKAEKQGNCLEMEMKCHPDGGEPKKLGAARGPAADCQPAFCQADARLIACKRHRRPLQPRDTGAGFDPRTSSIAFETCRTRLASRV